MTPKCADRPRRRKAEPQPDELRFRLRREHTRRCPEWSAYPRELGNPAD